MLAVFVGSMKLRLQFTNHGSKLLITKSSACMYVRYDPWLHMHVGYDTDINVCVPDPMNQNDGFKTPTKKKIVHKVSIFNMTLSYVYNFFV